MDYPSFYLIIEKLDLIIKKLNQEIKTGYLTIKDVKTITTLSESTIRRAIKKGHLKCKRRLGKLLFLELDVRKWLDG